MRVRLALAALLVSAVAVTAGCRGSSSSGTGGSGGNGSSGPSLPQSIGLLEGSLDLIAGQGYNEDNVVKPFEKQTGCQVNIKYNQTSDEVYRLMQSGSYDGVSASGEASNRLIASGLVSPINTNLISDFTDITPQLQSAPFNTVDGIHYGVSYQWGANILMYNKTAVSPAPDSWDVIFDGASYKGKVDAYDSAIYIADAAVYLKATQPDLKMTDPYELTQPQFDAAVNLLKQQHQQIGNYWSSATAQARSFTHGSIVIGPSWPNQLNTLKGANVPVEAILPKEGATGWADSWMEYSKAAHPNCMLKWMDYASTPEVQAVTAYTVGSAPANPRACAILEEQVKNYCTDYHVTDPAYLDHIAFWKTPLSDCGDSRGNTCIDYSRWQRAWVGIKNS